ncbi:MAG: HEPN domain-containing protein, partial [Candidatus Bathyarchaeales archaeon]
AQKLMEANEYFAAVLCAATGVERATMGLILHLGARPATKHRHHEVLRTLQPLIQKKNQKEYREATEAIAELMGHLTMVRYKFEVGGEYKTPKQLYDEKTARQLYTKAEKTINFIKRYTHGE